MLIDAAHPKPHPNHYPLLLQVLLPFVVAIYLGIVMKKYSLEGYSDLVTNDFLLLGFKDVEALRKHVADNLIGCGSCAAVGVFP